MPRAARLSARSGTIEGVMAVDVSTSVYEGPFDLLLHLILKEQVDLYEVSLSKIVDEYLARIGGETTFACVALTASCTATACPTVVSPSRWYRNSTCPSTTGSTFTSARSTSSRTSSSISCATSALMRSSSTTMMRCATPTWFDATNDSTVGTLGTMQRLAFTSAVWIPAGLYFVGIQYNGNTATIRTAITGSYPTAAPAITFGTPANITAPTSFTTAQAPIVQTY